LIGRIISSQKPIVAELSRNHYYNEGKPGLSSVGSVSPFGTSPKPSLCYHSFDLEGIAVDDYGYVVTITAENGDIHKMRNRKNWSFGGIDFGKSMWKAGRSAFHRRENSTEEKIGIEIGITQSLEMRESFYDDRYNKSSWR
jgi:hypothetical protein